MARSRKADWQRSFEDSSEPMFLLDGTGELRQTNQALERLAGLSSSIPEERDRLKSTLLFPPADLPEGQPRVVRRAWGDPSEPRWLSLLFLPLTSEEGRRTGFLGYISPAEEQPNVPEAIDSSASARLALHRAEQARRWGFEAVPARGENMHRLMHQLQIARSTSAPVVLIGETGTGKTGLAHVIHYASDRQTKGITILDARALPRPLQKRELFGEPTTPERGLIDDPEGGTVLVLGLAQLSADVQEQLADVMSNPDLPSRLIFTERQPLEKLVEEGILDRRLYFLVSSLVLHVPPLRERMLEIPDHCESILEIIREEESAGVVRGIAPEALSALVAYHWPGNLVELEGVLRTAARRATAPLLTLENLPRKIAHPRRREIASPTERTLGSLDEMLDTIERRMVELALRKHKGNKSAAALELGISRPRLHRRAEQLGFQNTELEPEPPPSEPTV